MGPGYEAVASDVKGMDQASLGKSPLGEKLFRTDFGSYKTSDVADGKFSSLPTRAP